MLCLALLLTFACVTPLLLFMGLGASAYSSHGHFHYHGALVDPYLCLDPDRQQASQAPARK